MLGARNIFVIASTFLCLMLTVTAILLWQKAEYLSAKNSAAAYETGENILADRAIFLWSKFNGEPADIIKKSRMAVVIGLEDRTCVQLKTIPGERGGLGGNPVYCFENESGQVVYKDEAVD